jgi:hypothetical protein
LPATFPSHAAAVVPLWLRWPRRFDLVALVVGSTTPDLAYVVPGLHRLLRTHEPVGLLWWCLPAGIVTTLLVRWSLAGVTAHLPRFGALALRDYGVLGRVRPRWSITVTSVLVGAVSHLTWDSFVHDDMIGARLFPVLLQPGPLAGQPWWQLLHYVSTAVGLAGVVALMVHIGRQGVLRRLHGEAPAVPVRLRLFWAVTVAVLVPGFAATLYWWSDPTGTIVRWLVLLALAPMAGALAVRLTARESDPGHTGDAGERIRR